MRREAGFTLIETMVVVVLIAILGAIAIPAINQWRDNYNLRGATATLYSDLTTARLRAIKDKVPVVVTMAGNQWQVYSTGPNGIDENGGNDDIIVITRNLSEFGSSVATGMGSATVVADPPKVLDGNNTTYTGSKVAFTTMGISNAGYFYLTNSRDTDFAVGTLASGVVKSVQWVDTAWK